jgi:hypothetical protein
MLLDQFQIYSVLRPQIRVLLEGSKTGFCNELSRPRDRPDRNSVEITVDVIGKRIGWPGVEQGISRVKIGNQCAVT